MMCCDSRVQRSDIACSWLLRLLLFLLVLVPMLSAAAPYPARIGAFVPRSVVITPKVVTPAAILALAEDEQELMLSMESARGELDAVFRLAELRATMSSEYAKAGELESAVDYLWSSLDLDPGHAQRWDRLGDLVLELNPEDSLDIAEQAYTRAAFLEPGNPELRIKLAALALQMRKFGAAIHHFEYLIQMPDVDREWNQMGILASLYAMTDELSRGIGFFQARYLEDVDDRFLLAEALLMKAAGQNARARQLLQMVETSNAIPLELRRYAVQLRVSLVKSGGDRLPGNAKAAAGWQREAK